MRYIHYTYIYMIIFIFNIKPYMLSYWMAYQVSKQTGEIEELRQEVKNRDAECLFKDVEMLNRSAKQIATIVTLREDLLQVPLSSPVPPLSSSFLFSFLHPFLPFRPVIMSLLLSFLPSSLFRPRFSKSPATSFNSKMDQKW